MSTLYDFSAASLDGASVPLSQWRGQVVLVVNVASQCGFTPQYSGLEALYQRFGEQGFGVLGFPCNQFGRQEPGDAAEIRQFCDTQYGISFPMFAKIDVNGSDAHPLYRWLKEQKPGVLAPRPSNGIHQIPGGPRRAGHRPLCAHRRPRQPGRRYRTRPGRSVLSRGRLTARAPLQAARGGKRRLMGEVLTMAVFVSA